MEWAAHKTYCQKDSFLLPAAEGFLTVSSFMEEYPLTAQAPDAAYFILLSIFLQCEIDSHYIGASPNCQGKFCFKCYVYDKKHFFIIHNQKRNAAFFQQEFPVFHAQDVINK